jgi:hypothetical protein
MIQLDNYGKTKLSLQIELCNLKSGYAYANEVGNVYLFLGFSKDGDEVYLYRVCMISTKLDLDSSTNSRCIVPLHENLQMQAVDFMLKNILNSPRDESALVDTKRDNSNLTCCLGQYYTEKQISVWLAQAKLTGQNIFPTIYTTDQITSVRKVRRCRYK